MASIVALRDGYFIDIGLPGTLARAGNELPARTKGRNTRLAKRVETRG